MRFEILDSVEKLTEMVPAWRRLFSACETRDFFQEPDWLLAWCERFADPGLLRFLVFLEGEELQGLIPLKISTGFFRVITLAGLPQSDRIDFLARPGKEEAVLAGVADWLCCDKSWDMLFLRTMGVFSDTPERLREAMEEKKLKAVLEDDSVYPFLDLRGKTFEDCLKDMPKKRCREFRRCRNKLEREKPELAFTHWTSLDENLIEQMRDINLNRSYKGERGETFFDRTEDAAFIADRAALYARKDRFRLFAYSEGDRIESFLLCFLFKNRLLPYVTSFDKEFAKYGLGGLTILDTIGYGLENGMDEFDFLEGDEPYKYHFTSQERRSRRITCYNKTAKGRLLRAGMALKPMLKRIAQGEKGGPLGWVRAIYRRIIS